MSDPTNTKPPSSRQAPAGGFQPIAEFLNAYFDDGRDWRGFVGIHDPLGEMAYPEHGIRTDWDMYCSLDDEILEPDLKKIREIEAELCAGRIIARAFPRGERKKVVLERPEIWHHLNIKPGEQLMARGHAGAYHAIDLAMPATVEIPRTGKRGRKTKDTQELRDALVRHAKEHRTEGTSDREAIKAFLESFKPKRKADKPGASTMHKILGQMRDEGIEI